MTIYCEIYHKIMFNNYFRSKSFCRLASSYLSDTSTCQNNPVYHVAYHFNVLIMLKHASNVLKQDRNMLTMCHTC